MNTVTQKACCCGSAPPPASGPEALSQSTDPVCGMSVDPAIARHQAEVHGQTYYFCSAGCRAKFVANPDQYLKAAALVSTAAPGTPVALGTIYTCPMHPQIRRNAA